MIEYLVDLSVVAWLDSARFAQIRWKYSVIQDGRDNYVTFE